MVLGKGALRWGAGLGLLLLGVGCVPDSWIPITGTVQATKRGSEAPPTEFAVARQPAPPAPPAPPPSLAISGAPVPRQPAPRQLEVAPMPAPAPVQEAAPAPVQPTPLPVAEPAAPTPVATASPVPEPGPTPKVEADPVGDPPPPAPPSRDPAPAPPPSRSPVQDGPTLSDPPPPPPGRPEPSVAPATPEPKPVDSMTELRRLQRQSTDACAGLDSYIARLTRREQVNGTNKPEEVLVFKFRRQPFSVHFKWIGEVGKGREVLYVQGQHGGKLHTLLAAGDAPLMAAGSRMALAPDSPLVRRASRHPITDAGICAIADGFRGAVAGAETGARVLRYLGPVRRPEFDGGPVTLEASEEELRPGADPALPRGGRRQILFDTTSHLPVLVITKDERGQEVEYYRFDRLQYPVRLDDDDFNPDKVWAKAKR